MRGYTEQISVKQYDTLAIHCEYSDDDGTPLSIAGVAVYADMQSMAGVVVDRLSVDIIDIDNGRFELIPSVDAYAPGTYKIDVLFEQNGRRVSSETFMLTVNTAVTAPRLGV